MFQPLRSLITVVLDPKNAKTTGGLILPDNFGDGFRTGTVRAIGLGLLEDAKDDVATVKPGDRVMVAQHQQQVGPHQTRIMEFPVIMDDGVACSIVPEDGIIGIIESVKN
jgi:co-chaperonin GroES (HSP10)